MSTSPAAGSASTVALLLRICTVPDNAQFRRCFVYVIETTWPRFFPAGCTVFNEFPSNQPNSARALLPSPKKKRRLQFPPCSRAPTRLRSASSHVTFVAGWAASTHPRWGLSGQEGRLGSRVCRKCIFLCLQLVKHHIPCDPTFRRCEGGWVAQCLLGGILPLGEPEGDPIAQFLFD